MKNEQQLIENFCAGNESAVAFMGIVSSISQVWDDLIDKDKPVGDAAINNMMWQALIDLNDNSFFVTHAGQLLPVMKKAIIDWQASCVHEQAGDPKMLKVSYIKRSCVTDLAVFVAYLCGGLEHSVQWAVEIERAVFRDDNFNDYVREQIGA
ncbi:MAG: hypothetical protein Q8N34_03170 [Gammaproteobacteria bacterium]|nr:hypothetical protein [Gammaproteobacteria bacterium]